MSQQLSQEIIKSAVIRSAKDPAFFCRFFLRHWFPTPMPAFHLGLLALQTRKVSWLADYSWAHPFLFKYFRYLSDPEDSQSELLPIFQPAGDGKIRMIASRNNEFVIPRGFSKTTLLNGSNLSEVVTDPATFTVYISESSGHAQTQLANIRAELESNALIRQAYGDLVPNRGDSEKWTGAELQLLNGAVIVAKGRGSQVRGINYRGRRPNKILLDDVEDKESVATPEQRKKTLDWFYNSVIPAGNEMSGAKAAGAQQDSLQITILGTLLGAETLITEVSRDPTFNTVRFGSTLTHDFSNLDDSQMLWAHKLSATDYLAKRQQYARVGQLAGFALEYDSVVRADEDAKFKREFFIYEPPQPARMAHIALALDPAISDQPGRDHTALVAAGRRDDGVIWCLETWGGLGKKPREKIDAFFQLYFDLKREFPNARFSAGIESVAYQKALIYLMREEMAKRQCFFDITPILQPATQRKDDRIIGILAPRYAAGYMRHRRRFPHLETMLEDFPNGKKDYPDALAMALVLLGETQMLAAPEASVVTQDEYAPLDAQPVDAYQEGPFVFNSGADPFKRRYG